MVLKRCGKYLRSVDTFKMSFYTPDFPDRIPLFNYCTNIESLSVHVNEESQIDTIIENCKNLKQLTLGCPDDDLTENQNNKISKLLSKIENLKYLKLDGTGFSGRCLSGLPIDTLDTFIITDCGCDSDIFGIDLQKFLIKNKTITTLKLIAFSVPHLNGIIKALSLSNNKLLNLRLECCDDNYAILDDEKELGNLFARCKDLINL